MGGKAWRYESNQSISINLLPRSTEVLGPMDHDKLSPSRALGCIKVLSYTPEAARERLVVFESGDVGSNLDFELAI